MIDRLLVVGIVGAIMVGYCAIGFFGTGIVNKLRLLSSSRFDEDQWIFGTLAWPMFAALLTLISPFWILKKTGVLRLFGSFVKWSERPLGTKKTRPEITA